MKKTLGFLANARIIYKENVNLSFHTYCKVGGNCKTIAYPDTKEKACRLIKYLKFEQINYSVIGETSNMLFLDDVEYGIIVSTKLLNRIEIDRNSAYVESGCNYSDFLRNLYARQVSGFEGLEGIPGSVGGAIYMNAGAYGYETSTHLEYVECIDSNGNLIKFTKNECDFKQRDSIFRRSANNKYLILSAKFNLIESKDENYYKKIERFHIARHSYQEFVLPNIGSIFTAKECVYKEFCKKDSKFSFKYKLYNKVFFNRFSKIFNRKAPNRKILNNLIFEYYKLGGYSDRVSIKHINMFANQNSSSWELIEYIAEVKKILGNEVVLENEIVTDGIVTWDMKKKDKYLKLIEDSKDN